MKFEVTPFIFETSNSFYCYDDTTKVVIPINKAEKLFLESVNTDEEVDLSTIQQKNNQDISYLLNRVNTLGMFQIPYKKYELSSKTLETSLKEKGIFHLCLVVTEACDFRCSYCIFSDYYEFTKSYSSKKMDFDTARKSIDYYFQQNTKAMLHNPYVSFNIGFYGGEPTLNWKLIEAVVKYVKTEYSDIFDNINFLMTTNGFTLTEKRIDFLAENHFIVSVSLDGTKENHDRNRVTHQLKPTYNVIFDNLKRIEKIYKSKKYPKFSYGILITFDNLTDFKVLDDFFLKNKFLDDRIQLIAPVSEFGTEYYKNQNNRELLKKRTDFIFNLMEKAKQKEFEEHTTNFSLFLLKNMISIPLLYLNYSVSQLRGACTPGHHKLTVDPLGNFHMCEKSNPDLYIGDVHKGIDKDRQIEVMSKYQSLIESKCQECNLKNVCQICYVSATSENGNYFISDSYCEKFRKSFKKSMSNYYELLEENPSLLIKLRK
ncbi:radical SAM protein [Lactococcus lactis]|uniref:Radical SAM protein n=1 Tax=Lactococcus lactis TaxID=1358 RepID=A0A9X4S812_9LACT|nr:radical SAM protein [Lactococcus lactis]MDG4983779.1 radical SAM protein [Lactococcus lactis]